MGTLLSSTHEEEFILFPSLEVGAKKIMARHYHVKSDRCQPKTKKDTSRKIHMVPRKKISKMSVAGWNFCDLDHLYQAYVNFTIG